MKEKNTVHAIERSEAIGRSYELPLSRHEEEFCSEDADGDQKVNLVAKVYNALRIL